MTHITKKYLKSIKFQHEYQVLSSSENKRAQQLHLILKLSKTAAAVNSLEMAAHPHLK